MKLYPHISRYRCLFQFSCENTTKLVFQPLLHSASGSLAPDTFEVAGEFPHYSAIPALLTNYSEQAKAPEFSILIVCFIFTDFTDIFSPSPKLTSTESRRGGLDKMTIIVAIAGSILGALVVILTALVCVRRFHRTRRFRHSAFRNRRCSDDDRLAIIAAYTGDVHFILPSYDEAISQVQNRAPPSFESVVPEGRNRNNQASDEPENCAGLSASIESDPASDTRIESSRSTSEQFINIAPNPLAESRSPPTSSPLVNLSSSSSEEDIAPRETRPLLDGP